ncbi:MAG: 4Fe-4S binding protein [Lachnospiraceae bacterium]|nr:4Fe-4S binding protein [Lachnospiraceae bacterium]
MIRQIIRIDEEKCNGCGICATACHEGAIDIVDGKAKLVRENFCDGFGDCLPACPAGAITFEQREAPAYDEEAVKASMQAKEKSAAEKAGSATELGSGLKLVSPEPVSRLLQWPCQIQLLPVKGAFYEQADILVAADCTAYAYANMHETFMKGRVTMIGCPKLDAVNYTGKLTEIFSENDIRSVTLIRMEVPCCGGLQRAVETALANSGKSVSCRVITVSRNGKLL